MRFTPELVWEAFRGLFRYVERIGSAGKLAVPRRLSSALPEVVRPAAEAIAHDLELLYRDHAIIASDRAFAYFYLWVQLLRCSQNLRPGPNMPERGKWRNLNWLPLRVLAGRAENQRENARAAFRKWHYDWVLREYPHPDEARLLLSFPWIPEYGERELSLARQQLRVIHALRSEYPLVDILSVHNSNGKPLRPGKFPDWHLWVLLAFRESWKAQLPWNREASLVQMLREDDLRCWELWRDFWIEAEPDPKNRCVIFPSKPIRTLRSGNYGPRTVEARNTVTHLEKFMSHWVDTCFGAAKVQAIHRRRQIGKILETHHQGGTNELPKPGLRSAGV